MSRPTIVSATRVSSVIPITPDLDELAAPHGGAGQRGSNGVLDARLRVLGAKAESLTTSLDEQRRSEYGIHSF